MGENKTKTKHQGYAVDCSILFHSSAAASCLKQMYRKLTFVQLSITALIYWPDHSIFFLIQQLQREIETHNAWSEEASLKLENALKNKKVRETVLIINVG